MHSRSDISLRQSNPVSSQDTALDRSELPLPKGRASAAAVCCRLHMLIFDQRAGRRYESVTRIKDNFSFLFSLFSFVGLSVIDEPMSYHIRELIFFLKIFMVVFSMHEIKERYFTNRRKGPGGKGIAIRKKTPKQPRTQ